jgi:hypothetical protein
MAMLQKVGNLKSGSYRNTFKVESTDGYKGSAQVGGNDEAIQSFDMNDNAAETADGADEIEHYKTQIRHRQQDRIARVKKASDEANKKGFAAFIAYILFFTFAYSKLCTKFVDCPKHAKDGAECTGPWTLIDSLYFVIVSMTTVGYGDFNFADESNMVRALFFIQSLGGFILITAIATNSTVTVRSAETALDFVVRADDEEPHPDEDLADIVGVIKTETATLLVLSGLMAALVMHQEGYDWQTALYFVYVSVSTVGFGDLCVETDISKIAVCCFLLYGCLLFANVITAIASYRSTFFDCTLMQKLLAFNHDGARISLFDGNCDGGITSGEFLIGYLVSLGKVRKRTCDEIIAKFNDLSLGKRYIDIKMFTARQDAISAGKEAGLKAAASATEQGLPPTEVAAKAGAAAAEAAQGCVATFKMPELDTEEKKAVGTLPPQLTRSYTELKKCGLAELSAMESALDKMMTTIRFAKNFEVKVALSAGISAGTVANAAGMSQNDVVAAAKAAAGTAGGTEFEQKTASARAIRLVVKATGAPYRSQSEAAAKVMQGVSLAEEEAPTSTPQSLDQGSIL